MKLLIDMQSVQAGSGKGGIGRYSYNLLEAMIKNNKSHDISVLLNGKLSMDIYKILTNIISKEKIYIFEAFADTQEKVIQNKFRAEASKLTREFIVSLINPDLFFVTSFVEGYFDNVVTSIGDIFPANRTVIILYDLIPLVQKEKYLQNINVKTHYMNRVSGLSKCGLLLSISEFSKEEGLELLDICESGIVNISSGVDKKFKPLEVSNIDKKSLYEKYNIKNKFLMYTSSFDIRKNQKNLILAYGLLDYEIRKEYQLLLIGNGSKDSIKDLKQTIKEIKLNQDEVIFLGYIDDIDLLNLYNLASLFVFPTFSEGFGLPALEAMSCALPTIGSRNTSVIEVINNEEAFFNPADISAIANKIQQVLTNKDFANKLKLSGLAQSKNFSWNITAQKTLAALEKKYDSLDLDFQEIYTNQYRYFIEKLSQIDNISTVSNIELATLSNYIDTNIKKYNKKIGIITTWNTRCGIASYSKYLSQNFISQSIILAPKIKKDELTQEDNSDVVRIWKIADDNLKQMLNYIQDVKLQTIFIQFNYGFFNFNNLSIFISKLVACGIKVYITLHSTVDSIKNKNKKLLAIKSLSKCESIFIHTQQDIENLNKIGINKNIVLLNQGIIDISPQEKINKINKTFVLATYGFFLETKGFINIIEAFKILKDQKYDIKLQMLNAKYSQAASSELIQKAQNLISKYKLEDYINLNTDYLSDQETIKRLHKTDLVVYPYEKTGESSSAAIRMAIAAKTNIAVTPQSIFKEVEQFVFTFDGDSIEDLANGIKEAISSISKGGTSLDIMFKKKEEFRSQNLYSKLSTQLKNIFIPSNIKTKLNIQVEGTYENQYSLSIVNKSIASALQSSDNIEVKVDATKHHFEYMCKVKDIDENIKSLVSKKLKNIDISIRNIYPPYTSDIQGDIKIVGPYGWEESKFPKEYMEWFNKDLDMIFTMSTYVENVLKENGVTIPIVTIGLVVEDILHLNTKAFSFELPKGFKLLHISSAFPRKGLDVLFAAFEKLSIIDITLIIKTFPNPHNKTIEQIESLDYKIETTYEENIFLYKKNDKQILLINKDIPQEQIKYLYENTDVLVAPSFGEGFGLPHAEAMLLELPVITTAYGGQTDFCTTETSWLIDYEFKLAKTHMNLKDSLWAVPKVKSLKNCIEDIYSLSQSDIKIKTIKAKKNILENFSSKKISSNILEAIIDLKS